MMLPGGAAIPAVHADRERFAERTGRRAVEVAAEDLRPERILTADAFHNSLVTLQAIGGSTNALVHVTAVANRVGVPIDLDEFDAIGRRVPVLVDLKPSGDHYMEHLYDAGRPERGAPRASRRAPARTAPTVSGRTLGENLALGDRVPGQTVVRSRDDPIHPVGGMAVLRGNLAPGGAVIKHSAASPHLLRHTGRAVVFDSLEDLAARIDDPALDVAAEDVLVLRGAGPKGAPGMPEAGYVPIPKKLAARGVKDMVRLSDARMSGTAFGAIVLHVNPESGDRRAARPRRERRPRPARYAGAPPGPAGVGGDPGRTARALDPARPAPGAERGYLRLFLDTVTQADRGCDFDFMAPLPTAHRSPDT